MSRTNTYVTHTHKIKSQEKCLVQSGSRERFPLRPIGAASFRPVFRFMAMAQSSWLIDWACCWKPSGFLLESKHLS